MVIPEADVGLKHGSLLLAPTWAFRCSSSLGPFVLTKKPYQSKNYAGKSRHIQKSWFLAGSHFWEAGFPEGLSGDVAVKKQIELGRAPREP